MNRRGLAPGLAGTAPEMRVRERLAAYPTSPQEMPRFTPLDCGRLVPRVCHPSDCCNLPRKGPAGPGWPPNGDIPGQVQGIRLPLARLSGDRGPSGADSRGRRGTRRQGGAS